VADIAYFSVWRNSFWAIQLKYPRGPCRG